MVIRLYDENGKETGMCEAFANIPPNLEMRPEDFLPCGQVLLREILQGAPEPGDDAVISFGVEDAEYRQIFLLSIPSNMQNERAQDLLFNRMKRLVTGKVADRAYARAMPEPRLRWGGFGGQLEMSV